MSKNRLHFGSIVLVAGVIVPCALRAFPVLAQGVPLPGSSWSDQRGQSQPSAPVPGMTAQPPQQRPRATGAPQSPGFSEPAAGAVSAAGRIGTDGASENASFKSQYEQLPLSPEDARARLIELRTLLEASSRPQEMQQSIYAMCEWLTDMAEAHNRLAVVFLRNDATKAQGQAERQAQVKFSALKNEALLLKADVLIKQRRYPEALGPLVDIVVQEPRTNTGKSAYQRLKELGFSEEVSADTAAAPSGVPATTAPAQTVSLPRLKPPQLLGSSQGTQSKSVKKR